MSYSAGHFSLILYRKGGESMKCPKNVTIRNSSFCPVIENVQKSSPVLMQDMRPAVRNHLTRLSEVLVVDLAEASKMALNFLNCMDRNVEVRTDVYFWVWDHLCMSKR